MLTLTVAVLCDNFVVYLVLRVDTSLAWGPLQRLILLLHSLLQTKIYRSSNFERDRLTWCQFHQRYSCNFFVRKSFWKLFSSYMYVEKAAEMTFVQKICVNNIDEIDT